MRKMMMKFKYLGVALMVLVLASCGGGGGGGGGGGVDGSMNFPQTCVSKGAGGIGPANQYGNYIVSANIWNAWAASSYTQCVGATISSPGGVSAEFDWNFTPTSNNGTVLSYPNIQYGQQSSYSPSTTPLLPAPISALPSLTATGTVTTTCTSTPCYYDTIFDVFFSSGAQASTKIQGELAIFTSYSLPYTPGGFVATNVPIGGATYNIYTTTMGGGSNSWPFVEYIPTSPITQLNMNINSFVADAVSRGYIPASYYLDMVEIGTEVISGQGVTKISNYSIQ